MPDKATLLMSVPKDSGSGKVCAIQVKGGAYNIVNCGLRPHIRWQDVVSEDEGR